MKISQLTIGMALLAVAHLVLRLSIPHLGFHRDELLYLAQSHHPALGYASVPPLTAWIGMVGTYFFGSSIWAAKVYPALLSGAMVFLVGGIAKEIGAGKKGIILSVAAYSLGALFFRAFYLFQPVCTDIFFWTLNWYLLLRILNGHSRAWYFLGISVGLGLLNKYLLALQVIVVVFLLLWTPERKWLGKREAWLTAGIALVLFLPNLWWQHTHEWPVFTHLQSLHDHQLVYVDRKGFLLDQLLMPFTGTLLTIPGILALWFAPKLKPYRILGWSCALVLLILLWVNGKSYYTAGIFIPLIAAGAWWWETKLKKEWMIWAMIAVMAFLTWPLLPMGLPVYRADRLAAYFDRMEKKYGLDVGRRFEDGSIHALPQDYADMLGWDELATLTVKAYHQANDPDQTVIYAENYGQAGSISILGQSMGLPEPISFNESFLYWAPQSLPAKAETLIYINDEMGQDVQRFFARIDSIGMISNPLAREYGTTVYLCSDPVAPVQQLWQAARDRVGNNPF